LSPAEKDASRVSIRILEREYLIACPPHERKALLDAAELLNVKMGEIRDSGKLVSLDRIAVMAALNLANEVLKSQIKDRRGDSKAGMRVRALRERIDGALKPSRKLDN